MLAKASASDLWLRLTGRHPHLDLPPAESDSDADVEVSIDADDGESPSTETSASELQPPCDHPITTTAGSNQFYRRKRCRKCHELLSQERR